MLIRRVIVLAALSCILLAPSRSYAGRTGEHENRIALELSSLGKQGDTIARARGQVLEILQHDNVFSAWFQEVDPDPAEVFQSLRFEVKENGPSMAYGERDSDRGLLFKHPWAAMSNQQGGPGSIILLNANGPFFKRSSPFMPLAPGGTYVAPSGSVVLVISSYSGDTPEAQITILLHELGHIIGRLPEDSDPWDGRSSQNTSEVSRHCKAETKAAAHNHSIVSN